MHIIGVAAAPAGGKSTVASMLQSLGAVRINADTIAHEVLQSPSVAAALVAELGPSIRGEDGTLDRRRIAQLVFPSDAASRERLHRLESLVHPATSRRIVQLIDQAQEQNAKVVVLDIPLLFENGWAERCDEVWFIDTPESIRLASARERGWTADQLRQREARQLALDEKKARSTRVIRNHGTIGELKTAVEKIWIDCGYDRR